MQGINCVKGEIHNVMTVLRLNQRRHVTNNLMITNSTDDNILLRGFYDLYDNLCQYTTLDEYNVIDYLAPFLHIIISNDMVYIDLFAKSTALNAIQKFLVYGLIHKQCSNIGKAVHNICVSVIHCRLDYNNLYTIDDVESVHMKLLEILCETLKLPVGEYLTDNIVCDMIYAAYNVRNTNKSNTSKNKSYQSSVLLQRYAENILSQMILVLYARLSPESHSAMTEILPNDNHPNINNNNTAPHQSTYSTTNNKPFNESIEHILRCTDDDIDPTVQPYKPYGIIALHHVLRFLAHLINPTDPNNTLHDRVLGLRLIRTVLETAGHRIGAFDILVYVIQNEICKYLLQSSNTTDLHILSLTLRIVYDLFQCVKQHLKLQLEVFFTSIHLRIGESSRSTYEQKELVIESLVEFCNEPSLIVGLYRNYDCELGCTDLYHDLCTFLCKYSLPQQNDIMINQLNLVSLEALIAVLSSINTRFCVPHKITGDAILHQRKQSISSSTMTSPTNDKLIHPSAISRNTSNQSYLSHTDPIADPLQSRDELSTNRATKQKLLLAATSFNKDGIKSLTTLQSLGVLPQNITAQSVVEFIRNTPGLELKTIGELFGSTNKFAIEILDYYCHTFDWNVIHDNTTNHSNELSIDDALRYFLSTFLLPGEAQQIDRIIERFAISYYNYSPGPLKSVDATHVLAYSVIMLNTDAHNNQVQKKMSRTEFIRNTRGINDGTDLPVDYLSRLYDSIVNNEIKLTQNNNPSVDDDIINIDQLTTGNKRLTGVFQTTTARIHGKNMFLVIWQNTLSCIITYLDTQQYSASNNTSTNEWYEYDNKLINKLVNACHSYASISVYYNLYQQYNTLIINLTHTFMKFMESDLTVAHTHSVKPPVLFGYDKRLQVIAQTLFTLVSKYGLYQLVESYTNVLHCILYLSYINVLRDDIFHLQSLVDYNGEPIDAVPTEHTHNEHCGQHHNESHSHTHNDNNHKSNGGFLSWGLSLFVNTDSTPSTSHVLYETGATDDTYIERAHDAIEQSHIVDVFNVTQSHNLQSIAALCNSLLLVIDTNNQSNTVYNRSILNHKSILFCIDALFYMLATACNNNHMDAIKQISTILISYTSTSITNPNTSISVLDRLLLNINTLSVIIDDKAIHTPSIIQLLLLFHRLPSTETANTLSIRVISVTLSVLKQCSLYIDTTDTWPNVLMLITQFKNYTPSAYASYQSIVQLIDSCCTSVSYHALHNSLQLYLQSIDSNPIKHNQLFDSLYKLHCKLDKLPAPLVTASDSLATSVSNAIDSVKNKGLQREKQRLDLWLSSLSVLCKYCINKRNDVRIYSTQCLYDTLIESNISIIHPTVWYTVFQHILLPLMNNTVKLQPDTNVQPQSAQPIDIRIQIVTIVYQTTIKNIDIIIKLSEFHQFWMHLVSLTVTYIGTLELYQSAANTQLINHTVDTLSNTILILYTTNIFQQVDQRNSCDVIYDTLQSLNKLSSTVRHTLYTQLDTNGFDANQTYTQAKLLNGTNHQPNHNGYIRPVKY